MPAKPKLLTGGPGRLCQALDITRKNGNGLDVTSPHSTIQIADDGNRPGEVQVTPRIGISKAADKPLRFVIGEIVRDRAATKRLQKK